MKQKAIALIRVSSEAQAGPDRQGLPGQRRAVGRIAAVHDLEIVQEVSIQVSGARVLEDARFRGILARIESPEIHGVIVADLDRLMRPEDPGYYSIFRKFRDTQTVLYTSAGPKDFRKDRLLMVLEAEIAALERQRIAERTRRGREEKRRQGRRAEGLVGMPRGVAFDPGTGEWSYGYPDAAKVQEAFKLFLQSDGTLSFAELNRQTGITPPDSKDKGAVSRALRNPIYKGVYRADRRWRDGKPEPREPHEIIEVTVLEPPLVSPEDWDRTQKLLDVKRARRAPRKLYEHQGAVYAGRLECSVCGAAMWVVPDSRNYRGYVCGNARYKGCTTGQTSVRIVDPAVDEALENRLGDIETLRRLIAKSAEEAAQRATAPPGETAAKISHLHNRRERAKDAYMEGMFELPELKKRLAKLDGEIALLERLLASEPTPVTLDEDTVKDLVDVFTCWRDLPTSEKRNLLEAYQIRIRLSRPARRKISVDEVDIGIVGSPDALRLYKKLRRYGLQ